MSTENIKIIIQNLKNIYENNISAKDIYACEYNNPLAIDIFLPIIQKNYSEIIMLHKNKFVLENIKLLYASLNNLKVDLNRLAYLIHYFLLYYLIKNNNEDNTLHLDCISLIDIFNNIDSNFTYISDYSKDIVLLEKIKNLKILDSKFTIITSLITIDETINFDSCNPTHLFNEQVEIIINHLEKLVSLINYVNTMGPITVNLNNFSTGTTNSNAKNFLDLCNETLNYKKILKKKSKNIFLKKNNSLNTRSTTNSTNSTNPEDTTDKTDLSNSTNLINKNKVKKNRKNKKIYKYKKNNLIKLLFKTNFLPILIAIILTFNLLTIGQYINRGYSKIGKKHF